MIPAQLKTINSGNAARLRNGARVSTSELSELSLKSNALKSAFDLDISRLNSRFQSRHTGLDLINRRLKVVQCEFQRRINCFILLLCYPCVLMLIANENEAAIHTVITYWVI
ncbi:hypothetical protein GQX74_007579 [Glossina fuscipes]|nr:hypothetical protein GQX74_007579 [Glossina fuscipes]